MFIFNSVEYAAEGNFALMRLEDDVRKLERADPVGRVFVESGIALARGNVDEIERLFVHARMLGAGARANTYEWTSWVNLGFAYRAHDLYRVLSQDMAWSMNSLRAGLVTASFDAFLAGKEMLDRAKIDETDLLRHSTMIATQAKAALQALDLNETDVRAMLDVAGEVLREEKLFWLRDMPLIRAAAAGGESFVLYQHFIGADRKRALAMTKEVNRRLEQRRLDKPGLAFCFLADSAKATGSGR